MWETGCLPTSLWFEWPLKEIKPMVLKRAEKTKLIINCIPDSKSSLQESGNARRKEQCAQYLGNNQRVVGETHGPTDDEGLREGASNHCHVVLESYTNRLREFTKLCCLALLCICIIGQSKFDFRTSE